MENHQAKWSLRCNNCSNPAIERTEHWQLCAPCMMKKHREDALINAAATDPGSREISKDMFTTIGQIFAAIAISCRRLPTIHHKTFPVLSPSHQERVSIYR